MNYSKIYSDFIADRRAKESALTGYSEKHHIVPVSLDGGNEEENIIRISAGDHYFAHLLLAKIHGGNQWAALWAIAGMSKGRRSFFDALKNRKMVAVAREKKAKMMRVDNPSHRPEVKEMRRKQMLANNPIHKIDRTGKNNPMYGVRLMGDKSSQYGTTMSDSHKKKMLASRARFFASDGGKRLAKKKSAMFSGAGNPRSLKVRCLETGIMFTTMKEAAEVEKIAYTTFTTKIKTGNLINGKRWEYV